MQLRKILYVDSEALNNYVSQIDGYTYEEETITNSINKEKGGTAGIELFKARAKVSNDRTIEELLLKMPKLQMQVNWIK